MPFPDSHPRNVVLDTDAYNEVDDQFALAHLLLSPDAIRLEAVYAAPFSNTRSTDPGDGMEKSHAEIVRLVDMICPGDGPAIFRGANRFLPDATTLVESEAARDLVSRARAAGPEKLYVLAIGAATNVASALLLEPDIAGKIVVVWLGGHGTFWPQAPEFNLSQDPSAVRVLLEKTDSLVLLPCHPVASHLMVSPSELREYLAPHGALGAYLTRIVEEYGGGLSGWSKVIWDLAASAWMVNPRWVPTRDEPCPVLSDALTLQAPRHETRRTIPIAYALDRNAIFRDFFAKARLGRPAGKSPSSDA